MDSLRRRVLAWLRIPAQPHVPPGEENGSEIFRAGPGYLLYQRIVWALGQVFGLVVLSGVFAPLWWALTRAGAKPPGPVVWRVLFAVTLLAVLVYVTQLLATYLVVTWDFECRYYVLTSRCLRIQEGIWSFREQTFTTANIQDIDVRQNPIQRLAGIADVVVSTAGGGGGHTQPGAGGASSMHVGTLRGVARPDQIRDRLLAQLKAYRDGGLGDEPARVAPVPGGAPEAALRAALQELAEESRCLRAALAGASLDGRP